MSIPVSIYIHNEKSARCEALIKHIEKYNPTSTIIFILNPDNLMEIKSSIQPGDILFILNENAILAYGEYYRAIMESHEGHCIYPTRDHVILESSKSAMRNILSTKGLGIYNPEYYILTRDMSIPLEIGRDHVIKADGLAGGKGVFVGGDHFNTYDEAHQIITTLFQNHEKILIEERLSGEEFSLITFCWKNQYRHFPCIRDFKRRNNGNTGPNTGGMGTISYPGGLMPFISQIEYEKCCFLNELVAIGMPGGFNGFLYGSFIKTAQGIKIIEYNVRPGDSEAVNMFAMLESSLIAYITNPTTAPFQINTSNYTYFRYIVPPHYPDSKPDLYNGLSSNLVIIPAGIPDDVWYPANVDITLLTEGNRIYKMSNSRVGGVYTSHTDYNIAIAENDRYIAAITGHVHYRTDIGESFQIIGSGNGSGNGVSGSNGDNPGLVNYIGHLNNYNHIITDIKAEIDRVNSDIELHRETVKVIGKIGDFANSIQWQPGSFSGDGNGSVRMICSVDGAGTKSKFLVNHPRRFYILGRDVVIHNLNDMYCQNGIPIGMLDYYGCDKLDKLQFAEFISGVLAACQEYGIPLIGGETAEMRGIFQSGEVEVLGILLGIIPAGISTQNGGDRISRGNVLYGISSTGAHTNGYTKLRGIQDKMPEYIQEFFSQPHRSYVEVMNQIKTSLDKAGIALTGMAHITGGGFLDNISRIFPDGGDLQVDLIGKSEWEMSSEWWWVYEHSGMEWSEFLRVFNAGWGFCFITDKDIPDDVMNSILDGNLDGDGILDGILDSNIAKMTNKKINNKIKKLGWII